jgi:hypothetical protein
VIFKILKLCNKSFRCDSEDALGGRKEVSGHRCRTLALNQCITSFLSCIVVRCTEGFVQEADVLKYIF